MRIQNISVVMSQAYEGNRSVADMRTHTHSHLHTLRQVVTRSYRMLRRDSAKRN